MNAALLALFVAAAPVPPAIAPSPELMAKLAAHAARLQKGLLNLRIEVTVDYRELGSNGGVAHEGTSVSDITFLGPHRKTTVLHATFDGKDNLAKAKEEAADNDRSERKPEGPFEAWNQPKHRFTVLGPGPAPGLLWLGIEPARDKAFDIFEGRALVDTVAGEAVRVEVRPTKLPAFVDHIDFVVDYLERLPGVGRTLSHISVDGGGGFLFFRKHRHLEIDIRYLEVGGVPMSGTPAPIAG